MKTILGLDLGVASIGWAIVKEDNVKQSLIASGVRVIPIDSITASDYSKGASTSKSQDRRQKRGARRNIHRYKLRKHQLIDFLKENNLWPLFIDNNDIRSFIVKGKDESIKDLAPLPLNLFHYNSLQLYGLRHKALSEQISLHELARIWFHLNQKRGYIDSRKGIKVMNFKNQT
jgi:CRISPR-associated endonuclease Csn1